MTITRKLEGLDVWIYNGQINIPNTYSAGATGSKFLTELRDRKKITGTRCRSCNYVYVPPRLTCKYCFQKMSEWTEVSDRGSLLTYAIAHQPTPVLPQAPPIVYGIVQLDGASTGLVHFLGEVALEDLKIGMRLQAVFKQDRTASLLDIKYFRPLD
ncbi:MAG: Zn-ribbon domain-containing OB-fold protein [Dehalococcoidia bacterium]|nr:Zn-ribbon domain-containing OB-fold protein [Dehalococcoidia bacterium]